MRMAEDELGLGAFLIDCVILWLRVVGMLFVLAILWQHTAVADEAWHVTAQSDGRVHQGCTAEREAAPGVFESVWLPVDKSVLKLTLEGVNFDVTDDQQGLLAVDDGDPIGLYVTHLSPWKNEMFVSLGDENLFRQLRNGRKLNVLVGEKKYAVDLAGSARMLTDLVQCNKDGQRLLNRKRMSDAEPALARSRLS